MRHMLSTTTLILAGSAVAAVLVSLLVLRFAAKALFALSRIRRHDVHEQILSW